MDEPDDRASRCRLGTYREWPCGRSATKKCDEFPPLHGLPRTGTARRIIISQIEELCRESRSGGLPLMVRFGSKADIAPCGTPVRFTPKSGHWSCASGCPLCAMCGRLLVGKKNLRVADLVGAAMCSAF